MPHTAYKDNTMPKSVYKQKDLTMVISEPIRNPYIEMSLNAKAYFEAYRGLCRLRISYSMKMADLSWFYCRMGKISQEKHDHAYHFWMHNRLYWERKLKESFKREKDYMEGK